MSSLDESLPSIIGELRVVGGKKLPTLDFRSNGERVEIGENTCLGCGDETTCVSVSADDPYQAAILCLPCVEKLASQFRAFGGQA